MRKSGEELTDEQISIIAEELIDIFISNDIYHKNKVPEVHRNAVIKLHSLYNEFELNFINGMYESLMNMYEQCLASRDSILTYIRKQYPQAEIELHIFKKYLDGHDVCEDIKNHYIDNCIPHTDLINLVLESY